jgi:hypothetical protein
MKLKILTDIYILTNHHVFPLNEPSCELYGGIHMCPELQGLSDNSIKPLQMSVNASA